MIKNKKWICIFIAVFILISGMWVDEVKADSIFLSPKLTKLSYELSDNYSGHTVLSDVEIEPTQILCTRNNISSRQIIAQIINSKKVRNVIMQFLLYKILQCSELI